LRALRSGACTRTTRRQRLRATATAAHAGDPPAGSVRRHRPPEVFRAPASHVRGEDPATLAFLLGQWRGRAPLMNMPANVKPACIAIAGRGRIIGT
jgi:hypothetical protein